ncbi:heavy metal translocating P-type ATPase [Bradyrhizobium sp. CER78]|uniref:heavy metal translocating P-type ATPase n=1 Tax=Bradyrhizobium sp. CER78 TaxID=3039162 RepID=UPI00244B1260|nr:heavy metal translocating P-type ATPase [Bradyrhizobium sp. CER78]MDH2385485.1 heavy metal translocating P-type ATPase [Bradyrhizobium sp. CER78]
MSCCASGADVYLYQAKAEDDEVLLASRPVHDGLRQTDLSVPGIHCGGCLQRIEATLRPLDGVGEVRASLSTRRVKVLWRGDRPPPLLGTLRSIGYPSHVHDIDTGAKDVVPVQLLRALAVAGFASSNIMLLSVSVWAGAETGTRDLFHWMSACIALPTLAYSGRIFFRSAWHGLRHGRTNMDVPITIGVLLTFFMSLYETIHHAPYAYFDAAVSLLFFLLIGRTLDHVMRERARQAVDGLARLAARGALVLRSDGSQTYLPVDEIEPGMSILLAAGDRVPVNARILRGQSELDYSLVSGESAPQPAVEGAEIQAGILNLTGPLTIVATATAEQSFLADMRRMMDAADAGRSTYRRIADRAARLYAPLVHSVAFLSFLGWMLATGDAHRAITIAIAVLIVTCPCALGLAVPMVHVVTARRLFEKGIMIKDGSALERLAEVNVVIFDKTGTLTAGQSRLTARGSTDADSIGLASALATHSRHPYSQALANFRPVGSHPAFDTVSEFPSKGVEARADGNIYRLGRPDWAVFDELTPNDDDAAVTLSINGIASTHFHFDDTLRAGAREAVADVRRSHAFVEILSGDTEARVRDIAQELELTWVAGATPADKIRHISALKQAGNKVLMIGDGLNDAAALRTADVSMAPASASDIGRNAADLVFLRDNLEAVPQAIALSQTARALIRQNFLLAITYNVVAIPLAVFGWVTPLLAAIAMSLSSVTVVANALRLHSRPRHAPGNVLQPATKPAVLGALE